jgi:hypothetical protein
MATGDLETPKSQENPRNFLLLLTRMYLDRLDRVVWVADGDRVRL